MNCAILPRLLYLSYDNVRVMTRSPLPASNTRVVRRTLALPESRNPLFSSLFSTPACVIPRLAPRRQHRPNID